MPPDFGPVRGASRGLPRHPDAREKCPTRSTYAASVWLITDVPSSLAPTDVFMGGHFFGRFDYANYPAVPYPKNPAPPQLTMPDFSKSPGGFGGAHSASDQTVQLAVLEEWAGCANDVRPLSLFALTTTADLGQPSIQGPLGVSVSMTYVPVVYNATTSS
ncbi:hypothetical protein BV20DRAFT_971200 [Pilatotrama ljubarskyi]|nr:hypothetical protein BV20DRAFT_971200 [Pilatotrama ljubarskyi]